MDNRLTVLIAEDSPADRMLLSTIVSRQGHRVLTAANGLEAVALFQQEQPQLVLMDALMPVMDGFEAARRIKQLAGQTLVPIIFLTSLTETDGLVELADDDRATLYGAFLTVAAKLRGEERDQALVLWKRKGKRAFEAESD